MKDLPAHSDVPLDGDSQRHVDGGTEGDGRHGVQEVDIDLQHLGLFYFVELETSFVKFNSRLLGPFPGLKSSLVKKYIFYK